MWNSASITTAATETRQNNNPSLILPVDFKGTIGK